MSDIDKDTKAEIDAETAQGYQDRLHAVPAGEIEATEVEESIPADIHFFRRLVDQNWPLLTVAERERQARRMLERHPFIEAAYRAGLRNGRDLRERTRRGLGWIPWPELEVLSPNERGFVMSRVKAMILT